MGCNKVTIAEILILKCQSVVELFSVTNGFLNIQSGKLEGIRTYSNFLITFLNSTFILSNLTISDFSPRLIYSSLCTINIFNCSFSSFYNFKVTTIYLEFNMSFIISESKFNSLSTLLVGVGSVNFYFFFSFSSNF